MTREEFVERAMDMQEMLYRISYGMVQNPHDQADAVQECLTRALQKYPTLREERYFKTWLVRILMNVCTDMLRRRKRECLPGEIEVVIPELGEGDMVQALSDLDVKYRVTLLLHHVEGYSTKEVASIMRVPEGTVKYRLTRGRALLQEQLSERGLRHETAR